MELVIYVVVMVATVLVHIWYDSKSAHGTLKIDHSNPEKDLYHFEIDNLDDLHSKSRVVFKIDHDAKLSQK